MSSVSFEFLGFIFRKTVLDTGMLQCVLSVGISVKGSPKISEYNIFGSIKYIEDTVLHFLNIF